MNYMGLQKDNWQTKKLGDLCEISTGSSNTVDAIADGQYAFFDRSKIIKRSNRFLFDSTALIIPGEGAEFFPRYYSGKFDLHQRAYALMGFNKETDIKFVEYYLVFNQEYFQRVAVGATAKSLRRRHFLDLQIPLPPLKEQHRIVKILDEVFEKTAKVKENTEKNLQNAKELFESYLQGVFVNKDNKWPLVRLSSLATDITDGDHMPPPKSVDGVPFITISNINKQTNEIDFSDTFSVSREYYDKLKGNRKPRKGDVLYTVTGSFGIPVVIESDFEFCFQRHIGLIRPTSDVESKWLYYLILSPQVVKQANDTATGTAQKTVSLTALRNFSVPSVSMTEQKSIVAKLDALSAETKKLEAIYKQKIVALEELKKSVLKKAFIR